MWRRDREEKSGVMIVHRADVKVNMVELGRSKAEILKMRISIGRGMKKNGAGSIGG